MERAASRLGQRLQFDNQAGGNCPSDLEPATFRATISLETQSFGELLAKAAIKISQLRRGDLGDAGLGQLGVELGNLACGQRLEVGDLAIDLVHDLA